MPNVTPFPVANIDMQLGEVRALLELLISLGENAEDGEFLRLRGSTVAMLYVATEKLSSADKSTAQLMHRRAS